LIEIKTAVVSGFYFATKGLFVTLYILEMATVVSKVQKQSGKILLMSGVAQKLTHKEEEPTADHPPITDVFDIETKPLTEAQEARRLANLRREPDYYRF
jgi:hypothetical protein